MHHQQWQLCNCYSWVSGLSVGCIHIWNSLHCCRSAQLCRRVTLCATFESHISMQDACWSFIIFPCCTYRREHWHEAAGCWQVQLEKNPWYSHLGKSTGQVKIWTIFAYIRETALWLDSSERTPLKSWLSDCRCSLIQHYLDWDSLELIIFC